MEGEVRGDRAGEEGEGGLGREEGKGWKEGRGNGVL